MSREHLPALDGVRGVAILAVLAFHNIPGAHSSHAAIRGVATLARYGWSGVTLFFILSGFLITRILWDSRTQPGWWKNFYMRRTLRIAPLYYATLGLVLLTAILAGNGHRAVSRLWIYALYLQNIPFLAQRASDNGSPLWLSHFWSLAVEEQFYLIWPLLITRARSVAQAKSVCLAVFFLSFAFRSLFLSRLGVDYNGFILVRAGELALGAYLSFCFRDAHWQVLRRAAPFVLAGSILSLVAGLPSSLLLAQMSLLWGSFLVLALGGGITTRAMSNKTLRWLGTISYGVYVFHVLFNDFYWWAARSIAPHSPITIVAPIASMITITLSLVLAWLSFRYFETPFLKLRRKFAGTPKALKPTVA